jgi:F-type H+-transporting ATPase subunit gamma
MPASPRIIRRRIRSVTNTRKITKAMELVAAAKMRKAVASVLATRPYADAAWRAVADLAGVATQAQHPLLTARNGGGKTLLILFSSDRGLCGGFNNQLLRQVFKFVVQRPGRVDVAASGRKGIDGLRRGDIPVVAALTGLSNAPRFTDIRPFADIAMKDFMKGTYDEVYLAYADYRSALTQVPTVRRLLPLTGPIAGLGEAGKAVAAEPSRTSTAEYLFEPSPQAVLDAMLPRLIEAQVWQALLESSASEHAARMLAMKSASDAADDLVDGLTLAYNQARQAGITREIAEISSGKAALEQ